MPGTPETASRPGPDPVTTSRSAGARLTDRSGRGRSAHGRLGRGRPAGGEVEQARAVGRAQPEPAASRSTVNRRGWRLPHSMLEMARTLRPARSASCSWVSPVVPVTGRSMRPASQAQSLTVMSEGPHGKKHLLRVTASQLIGCRNTSSVTVPRFPLTWAKRPCRCVGCAWPFPMNRHELATRRFRPVARSQKPCLPTQLEDTCAYDNWYSQRPARARADRRGTAGEPRSGRYRQPDRRPLHAQLLRVPVPSSTTQSACFALRRTDVPARRRRRSAISPRDRPPATARPTCRAPTSCPPPAAAGADRRHRRRLRRPQRRGRPRHLPLAVRPAGLHHRQRLLQEGQPERRPPQLPAGRHRLGRRDLPRPRHGLARSARTATSCWSRPTPRPSTPTSAPR